MSQNGLEGGTSHATTSLSTGRDTVVRSIWKQFGADANSGLEALYLIASDVTWVFSSSLTKFLPLLAAELRQLQLTPARDWVGNLWDAGSEVYQATVGTPGGDSRSQM